MSEEKSGVNEWVIGPIDLGNEEEVEAYEKALYRGFPPPVRGEDPVRISDRVTKRTRSRVPYTNQLVFAAQRSGKVYAACAINFGMDAQLQLELRQFSVDKSKPAQCEVLHLFMLLDPAAGGPILRKLQAPMMAELKNRGIRRVYATCLERKMGPYQSLGFRVIDERESESEKWLLIEMELDPSLPDQEPTAA